MDSLRADSGIRVIEVNDSGECISIPVGDASFFERFSNIIKGFSEKQAGYEKRAQELSEKYKDHPDGTDAIFDGVQLYSEMCRETCVELDRLFGEGCCRKVFPGVESPGIELITDFLEKLAPFMNKYAQERSEKISLRYSRGRKGAGN